MLLAAPLLAALTPEVGASRIMVFNFAIESFGKYVCSDHRSTRSKTFFVCFGQFANAAALCRRFGRKGSTCAANAFSLCRKQTAYSKSFSKYKTCKRFRLDEGSLACLLAAMSTVKELARAVRYFPRAATRAADCTMWFNIHCLLFYCDDDFSCRPDINNAKIVSQT